MKSWPGDNPYKIVVATNQYRLLTSDVFGGEEWYESSALKSEGGRTFLNVTCLHRPMSGGVGTYRYELSPDKISHVGGVVWDDPSYWKRFFAAMESEAKKRKGR
jgi:hypothetical protein